jgi:hypothetical protein
MEWSFMMRAWVLAVLLVVFPLSQAAPVSAAGYCPSQPGGKCPVQKKKTSKSRDDFSADQREKLMADARALCKKRYGSSSRVYRFDYKKWTVICTEP